ncbi:tail fiber protein [Synechococcus phage S-SBP1]|uniref:Tail fiber protein n=1 Tax=Synechococcus phage S-SBP1 TaxID=2735125 RepID=A0A6M4EQB9_9CAUD|nr:tail fiber protein [Synechococcus phage S-SBP1]
MSTLKVTNIEHGSTTDGGIQLDSSGHVTVDGQQLPTSGAFSGRNLIINGAQEVDQRDSGSSAIGTLTGGKYITDRWKVRGEGNTTGQGSQSGNVPDGFVNSLLVEVGATANARSADTNRFIRQNVEGYVLRRLRWGTSAAKAATISFWIKSSLTGTYSFSFFSGSLDQHYVTNYTINTADTWEFKTISVPGPTSGTFRTDNGLALFIQWDLGTGTNYQTSTLDQWASGDKRCSNNAVDFFNTANATLRITGIQFEMGEKATPFEYRSYGDELARCMRYYETGVCFGMYKTSDDTFGWTQYSVQKRTNPTVELNPPGSNPSTNQAYYHSTDSSDRGNRAINEINPSGQMPNQTNFKNGFIATMGGFTPASTNDAMWTSNYIAEAEL